jgi:hypothetical protein
MKKNLKPIPAGNKGLPKLPKTVRNNMGFLKAGGMVKDKRSKFMGGGIAYAGGGKAMPRVKRAAGGPGLYANIAAKKARIKAGSGETMRKKGAKGAPTAANFKRAAQTAKS